MMSVASLSAAAPAAISTSSTALSVAVTCAARPPHYSSGFYHRTSRVTWHGAVQGIRAARVRRPCHAGRAAPSAAGRIGAWFPVKCPLRDILHDAVRHQVPDGLPLLDPLAAIGRGDRQRRDLDQADPAVRQPGTAQVMPGPGAPDEMLELEQLVGILPGHHLLQGIGAGD